MGVTGNTNGEMRKTHERSWKFGGAEATWKIQTCSRGQDEIKMDVRVFTRLN
jgi:hypothetical protein